jgi:nucleotidyltransferase/DNA polymerase involved in DNA repair
MRAVAQKLSHPVVCVLWQDSLNVGKKEKPSDRLSEHELRELLLLSYEHTPSLSVRRILIRETWFTEGLFLDFTGRPEESLDLFFEALDDFAHQCDFSYSIGVGDDAPEALLHARYTTKDVQELPLEALWDSLNPFRPKSETRKEFEELAFNLYRLGLQTVKDFQSLPPETLSARFGALGNQIRHQIEYGSNAPWPKFRIEESIVETMSLGDGESHAACQEVEPLIFLMKQLLDRTFKRLHRLDLRLNAIELRVKLDTHSMQETSDRRWAIELAVPQSSSGPVLPLIREKVSLEIQKRPLEQAIAGIEVRVIDTAPGHGNQKNFFHRQEEEAEQFDELIHRLAQRIGTKKVFRAQQKNRHLPEKAWGRAAWGSTNHNGNHTLGHKEAKARPARPLRLLSHPVPLIRIEEKLRAQFSDQQWNVVSWRGPERLFGEWWSGEHSYLGFERDYYQVWTQEGQKLWVYGIRGSKRDYFLHGYFD